MGKNNGGYEKYDHSKVISQQIERVNKLITEGPQDSGFDSFDQYFHQVVMGLMTLDGLLDPFKDEEYGKNGDGPLDDLELPNKTVQKLEFVRDTMRKMTNLLNREDLFYVKKNGRRQM